MYVTQCRQYVIVYYCYKYSTVVEQREIVHSTI